MLSTDFTVSQQNSLFAIILCKKINNFFSSPASCMVFMDKQLALVSTHEIIERQLLPIAKAAHERSERQRPPIPKAAPWLVFPHGKGRKSQSFYNPCEPNNRNCIKSIPEMRGRAYYHKTCHRGWLIVIGDVEDNNDQYSVAGSNLDECFLWNPESLETIRLPKLNRPSFTTKRKSKDSFLYDLVLSSPPLPSTSINAGHDDDDDCTVFLLFRGVEATGEVCNVEHILAFCRPGDEQWKTKELYSSGQKNGWPGYIESLICFKGNLYAFGCIRVGVIGIKKLWHNVDVDEQTEYIRTFEVNDVALLSILGGHDRYNRSMQHWLESGNEIFRVYISCSPRGYRNVTSIHILKLDFSSMAWVLLRTLDDHVLFVGTNQDSRTPDKDLIKCYSASTASCSAADMGLERGCLFYALPEDQTLYVFEVEDRATTAILPCLKPRTPWFQPTWIMMPTTTVNRHVVGTRVTLNDFLLGKDAIESTSRISKTDHSGGGGSEMIKHKDILNDYHDSIEVIARYLHPVDYVHFRLVCKQNSILLHPLSRTSSSRRTTKNTYLSPWLISIFQDDVDTICDIVDPMHNNDKYLMKLSDQLLVGATIRFSKDGWLVFSSGMKTVFFYNPFTRATIRLPDLPDNYTFSGMSFSSEDYTLGGISFSSLPTSPDCVVMAISNWFPRSGGVSHINFLVTELGKSAAGWISREFEYEYIRDYMQDFVPCINNPVFYKGAFYCLDYNGLLGVFSAKGDFRWEVLPKSMKQFGSGIYPSFLVECDDKLLLVNLGQSGKSIKIYRVDESKMVWVELKSLGKYALFISYTSSFSVVAPRSCMENKIYLPRLYGQRILYYSLDTCRYHCVGSSDQYSLQDFHNTKERSNCTWIEPNWSHTSLNQETDGIVFTSI